MLCRELARASWHVSWYVPATAAAGATVGATGGIHDCLLLWIRTDVTLLTHSSVSLDLGHPMQKFEMYQILMHNPVRAGCKIAVSGP